MDDTAPAEEVVSFNCDDARLWGILSRPPNGTAASPIAVLVVVGGPQYRVGSHRQFVLLARTLARRGFPTLRFDYRGMGDSEGEVADFKAAGPDLRVALDALSAACPGSRIVVWGLCDAAAAALMFATSDPRVFGIVAANPWAHSDASLAAARVKHYYAARLLQREFWLKLLRGGLDLRASLSALLGNLKGASTFYRKKPAPSQDERFQTRMARGLASFRGHLLLILSGNDLTAKEFVQYTDLAPEWRGLLTDAKVSRVELADADHTFSRRVWQDRAEQETCAWLSQLCETAPAKTMNG